MAETSCRYFNGYKPCTRAQDPENCNASCSERVLTATSLLIVHLGALGAVVRSTSLLAAMRRKYPNSKITWVTDAPAQNLLLGNPWIDRVLTTSADDLIGLRALRFDVGFVIDKSLKASGVLAQTHCDQVFGFKADAKTGAILPATPAAEELWQLGLSNQKKFFVNQKPETQLMIEALELGDYQRDPYFLPLTNQELELSRQRHQTWASAQPESPVIGLNTGCASVIPAKKWTVEFHRQVIEALLARGHQNLVVLGGREDTERNRQIALGLPVSCSPTDLGLRDGLASVEACDVVITGDSLGMHMAIARKKQVVAWFGPTCAQEIDLFDRGVALRSALGCSPCWKRTCENKTMCYDQLGLEVVLAAIENQIELSLAKERHCLPQTSTYKQLSLETSVLRSPRLSESSL